MTQTAAPALPAQYVLKLRLYASTPTDPGWVFLTGLDADTTLVFTDFAEVTRVVQTERRGDPQGITDPNAYIRAFQLVDGDLIQVLVPVEPFAPAPF